jgi:hypothetical protein
MSIDLVNEKLCLCQRCPEVNVDLNKCNCIRKLREFPKEMFNETAVGCDSCIRLCYDKLQIPRIEQILKNRRVDFESYV